MELHTLISNGVHKLVGDGASIGVTAAVVVGWLPHIASGLSVIWIAIRIYETRTVQHGLRRLFREIED